MCVLGGSECLGLVVLIGLISFVPLCLSRHFSTLPEALSLSTWPPLSLTLTFLHNHRRRLCARLHHPWGMLTRSLHAQGGCGIALDAQGGVGLH